MSYGTKSSILQTLNVTFLWKVKLVLSKHHLPLRKDLFPITLCWLKLINEELKVCNTADSQAAFLLFCTGLMSAWQTYEYLGIPLTLLMLCLTNFKQFLTFLNAHSYSFLLLFFPPLPFHFYNLFYFSSLLNTDKPNNSIIAISNILHINLIISSSTTFQIHNTSGSRSSFELLERNVLW